MTSKSKTSKTRATAAAEVAVSLGAAREALELSCKAFSKVAEIKAAMEEKKVGSYTMTVSAAIAAGSLKAFTDVYAGLVADISGNVAGIARQLGCKHGKPDESGKSVYVVPGSLMVAVSVVKSAMGHKIPLQDKDGQRSYGSIRKDKEVADAAAKEAKETPLQTAQRKVREAAAKIAEGSDALTLTEANDCYKILLNLIAVGDGSHKGTHEPLKNAAAAMQHAA